MTHNALKTSFSMYCVSTLNNPIINIKRDRFMRHFFEKEKTIVSELDCILFCLFLPYETAGVMIFFYFVSVLLHDWVSFY